MKEAHKLLLTALINDGLDFNEVIPLFDPRWREGEDQAIYNAYLAGHPNTDDIESAYLVSIGDTGASVLSWVWVPNSDADVFECSECGIKAVFGDDTYDDLCPSCADKAEEDDDG